MASSSDHGSKKLLFNNAFQSVCRFRDIEVRDLMFWPHSFYLKNKPIQIICFCIPNSILIKPYKNKMITINGAKINLINDD